MRSLLPASIGIYPCTCRLVYLTYLNQPIVLTMEGNISDYSQTKKNSEEMETSRPTPTHDTAHRLVVGIDFGTTYSGVGWAHTAMQRNTSTWITNWPSNRSNSGRMYSAKVPTQLRYLSDNQVEWGYQIPHDVPPQDVLSLFKL